MIVLYIQESIDIFVAHEPGTFFPTHVPLAVRPFNDHCSTTVQLKQTLINKVNSSIDLKLRLIGWIVHNMEGVFNSYVIDGKWSGLGGAVGGMLVVLWVWLC